MGWMGCTQLRGDCVAGHVPNGASLLIIIVVAVYPVDYCVICFCKNRHFSSSNFFFHTDDRTSTTITPRVSLSENIHFQIMRFIIPPSHFPT